MSDRDHLKALARASRLRAQAFQADAIAALLDPHKPAADRQSDCDHATALAMQYLDRADFYDAEAETA